jgi:hypothetical protein
MALDSTDTALRGGVATARWLICMLTTTCAATPNRSNPPSRRFHWTAQIVFLSLCNESSNVLLLGVETSR